MHQPVCQNHYEQEVRLRTLERDVGEMKGEIKEIKRDVATITHDVKNVRQSSEGLMSMMQAVLSNNADMVRTIKENRSEMHLNYIRIIKIMTLGLVMVGLGRVLDLSGIAI